MDKEIISKKYLWKKAEKLENELDELGLLEGIIITPTLYRFLLDMMLERGFEVEEPYIWEAEE